MLSEDGGAEAPRWHVRLIPTSCRAADDDRAHTWRRPPHVTREFGLLYTDAEHFARALGHLLRMRGSCVFVKVPAAGVPSPPRAPPSWAHGAGQEHSGGARALARLNAMIDLMSSSDDEAAEGVPCPELDLVRGHDILDAPTQISDLMDDEMEGSVLRAVRDGQLPAGAILGIGAATETYGGLPHMACG